MPAARDPPLVVEGSVAEHLEILSRARALRVRVLPIERVGHADPLDGLLGHAVDHRRFGDSDDVEYGRHHVDHMMKLETRGANICDPRRPSDDHSVSGSTKMGRDLLDPLEWRIAGPGPTHRKMRAGPG